LLLLPTMRQLRWILPALLACPLASLGACSAEGTDDYVPDGPGPEDPSDPTDPDAPTLSVTMAPEETRFYTAPIEGMGPSRGTLLVQSQGGNVLAIDIGPDGRFCVDVLLERGTLNHIMLQALDSTSGAYTNTVLVEVLQQGDPPEAPQDESSKNVALSGSVERMSVVLTEGVLSYLNDGDPNTFVDLKNNWDGADWLILRLGERAPVELLRIEGVEGCHLQKFAVMLSDADQPGDPRVGHPDWWTCPDCDVDGAPPTIEFRFDAVVARFVGIHFKSRSCGGWVGHHKVREIQAWTPPAPAPPAEQAPSCAGGGF
jgi:hypothetical protein